MIGNSGKIGYVVYSIPYGKADAKGLSTKKISYRFLGKGARGQGAGGKEKYYLSKLDNLFSGSPFDNFLV